MSKYKYICPTEKGMLKLPVTLRQLYAMGLAKRGRPLFIRADVYACKTHGVIEYRKNLLCKMILLLLAPLLFLVDGFNRRTLHEIKRELSQSKYGSFSSDSFNINPNDKIGLKLCAIAEKMGV